MKTYIYYKVNPWFSFDENLTVKQVESPSEFRLVRAMGYYTSENLDTETLLEHIYRDCQGENWSPNGEARFLITQLGLTHTSMSVGDVICFPDQNKYYQVASCGFQEVPNV